MHSGTGHLVSGDRLNEIYGHLTLAEKEAALQDNGYELIPESHMADALENLGGKKETFVDLTQTKKNRLAALCEQWRKAGFSKNRIRKHKQEWIKQNS